MIFLNEVRKISREDIHISFNFFYFKNYGFYSLGNRIVTYWNILPDKLIKLNDINNFKKGLDRCIHVWELK